MPLKYCPTIQVLAVSSTTTYPSEIEHHQNGDCLILGTPELLNQMIIVYLNEQCTKMETLSLYTCTIESWIKGINILTVNITTSSIEKALRNVLLYIFSILYIYSCVQGNIIQSISICLNLWVLNSWNKSGWNGFFRILNISLDHKTFNGNDWFMLSYLMYMYEHWLSF